MKRYDLMHDVNSRGSFLLAKTALPHLLESDAAHGLGRQRTWATRWQSTA